LAGEFRRNERAADAIAVLLAKDGYPRGFRELVALVEDSTLPPHMRRWTASQLPRIQHPRSDRYVRLLLQNTADDRMRCFVLEGFWRAGRAEEGVDLLLSTVPSMRDPASISRALGGAAHSTASPRLLPLVFTYAGADSPILRAAAFVSGHSLFWGGDELEEHEDAQILDMWRRARGDPDPQLAGLAEMYMYEVEHAGLPRTPRHSGDSLPDS